jgi:hypothetical protein
MDYPPPEFHIATAWEGGLSAPSVAVKIKKDGLNDMLGLAAVHATPNIIKLSISANMTAEYSMMFFIFPLTNYLAG